MSKQSKVQAKKTLNERFTDLADIISEGMGTWPVSTIAFVLILAWTAFCAFTQGSSWWYSQFYNFPLNLVTTIAELFIGFLIAAAANRVERRHDELLQANLASTKRDEATTKRVEDILAEIKAEIVTLKEGRMP